MKRRDFILTTAAGATASVVLKGCGNKEEKLIPLLVSEETLIPGVQTWTAGVCRQCSAGCGIIVKTMPGEMETQVNGEQVRVSLQQAKKIEGNPDFPVNRGKLCARGQAGLQVLYNPDRIKGPLKLTGARGSGQYQPISWDEAIATLASKLRELRDRGDAHTTLFLNGRLPHQARIIVERFMQAFGSPNSITHELFSDQVLRSANRLTAGHEALAAYDLENANYLISFGATFLETFGSPARYNLGFGHMRQGRPGQRAKFIQVEPRLSLTAANADEWVPVKPGTEGALALALAHVIIQEQLYDKNFIAQSTTKFEDFKNLVLQNYSPETVAPLTEVPAERIKRIAREFAKHQPALAIGGDAAGAHSSGLAAMTAVNALNALVGNYGKPGGIYFDPEPPLAPLPAIKRDAVAERGLNQPPLVAPPAALPALSERLFSRSPYPVNAVLLYETNPVFTAPAAARVKEALEQAPFVASFSSFMDETTKLADLILPDHTALESWIGDVPEPGVGIPVVAVAQPVVKPLYETRSTPDVLMQLAKQLGGGVAEAFPYDSFSDSLKASCQGIFQAKRGSVVADDFDTFWGTLIEKGGWWDSEYKPAVKFSTPSGKFEFASAASSSSSVAETSGQQEYPFYFHPYQSLAFSDGRGANQPWLQEMPDPMTTACWGSWVEINPKTAEGLGLKENDLVWIESPHGRIQAPVVLYPGTRPDTINMPVGQGHEAYGRYAENRGANPIKILAPLVEPRSGQLAWAATRVKLTTAGGSARLVKIGFDRQHSEAERK
jgi:anaerobic selenocysteine-containing dehydrogenase